MLIELWLPFATVAAVTTASTTRRARTITAKFLAHEAGFEFDKLIEGIEPGNLERRLAVFAGVAWDAAKAPVKVPIVVEGYSEPLMSGQHFETLISKRIVYLIWAGSQETQ